MINFCSFEDERFKLVEKALSSFNASVTRVAKLVVGGDHLKIPRSMEILCPFLSDLMGSLPLNNVDPVIIIPDCSSTSLKHLVDLLTTGCTEACTDLKAVVEVANILRIDIKNIVTSKCQTAEDDVDLEDGEIVDSDESLTSEKPHVEQAKTFSGIKVADFSKSFISVPNMISDSLSPISNSSIRQLTPTSLAATTKKLKCPLCTQYFEEMSKMMVHLKANHENGKIENKHDFWCGLCRKGFETERKYEDHEKIPHKYGCKHCHLTYILEVDLNHHVEKHHVEKIPKFHNLASDNFEELLSSSNNKKEAQITSINKLFSISNNEKLFSSTSNNNKLYSSTSNNNGLFSSTSNNNKLFSSTSNSNELFSSTGINNTLFSSTSNNNSFFSSTSNMNKLFSSTSNSNTLFSSTSNMNKLFSSTSSNNKLLLSNSIYDKESSSNINKFYSSIKNYINESPLGSDEKEASFKCPECDRVFSRKVGLKMHMKNTTKHNITAKAIETRVDKSNIAVKPVMPQQATTPSISTSKKIESEWMFKCEMCELRFFKRKCDLNNHKQGFHNWCSGCFSSFKNQATLKKHREECCLPGTSHV